MKQSPNPKALEIRNLSKTYPNGFQAVQNIDLDVASGDFFALLGANGAGKSTTIGMITTLLDKTCGTVYINGYDLDKQTMMAKRQLGLVPQEFNLNIFESPHEIILNQAGYYGISRKDALPVMEQLLEQLGLMDKRHNQVRELSGGMKRRVLLARALVCQPDLLLLDEPTNYLDIESITWLEEFMLGYPGALLFISHDRAFVRRLATRIIELDRGQLSSWPGGYDDYLHRKAEQLEVEARHNAL